MSTEWKDITEQLRQATKAFKLFEIACPENYNLEDSMQATQMNDEKVDVKTDLSPAFTLHNLIQSKAIKHPSQLTLQDLIGIYDYAAGFEVMYMKEYPIAQSIYTISYLFDRELSKQNEYLLGLIDSINTFGSYFRSLLRQSMTIRDDDNTFSPFGFTKDKKSNDEIIEILLKLQKLLETHAKNNKEEQKLATALNSRIKSRRFLHLLLKEMGNRLENKNADKVKKSIESYRKRIDDVVQYLDLSIKPEGVFNENIYKTLRTNLSPREIRYPDIKQTYGELRNMINQIDMFLPVPQTFSEILERIDQLLALPLNKLSKSYIVSMFFRPKAEYLDSAIPLAEAIGKDIIDWLNLKENTLKSEKFQELTTQTATFMNEILLKMFLNKPRWQWETSRVYENYNYIVHLSSEFDNSQDHKKDVQIISYAYYIGMNHMIKQLQMGIQIDLYYPEEYGYIFCYMEYLFNIANRNSMIFLKKFDKGYLDAFDEKTLTNKIKKKVSPNMRKMLSSIIFNKGLNLYYSAMSKLFFLLMNDKLIVEGKNEKERYISRFQIFRKVLFIKPADYNSYREELQKAGLNREETIKSIESNLKQSQSLFSKLSILEESDIFSHTRNQLGSLNTLCVRQSLQVMRYKMSKQGVKKVNISKSEPHYIEVSI